MMSQKKLKKKLRKMKCSFIASIPVLILLVVVLIIIALDTEKAMLITGKSMEPTIKSGTFALIKSKDIEDIRVNDIICFKDEEDYVVHKVIEVNTNAENEIEIRTKGDANKSLDKTVVNKSNYIGELGLNIWMTYIFLEILPKILGGALTILLVVQANVVTEKRKRKRRAEQQ